MPTYLYTHWKSDHTIERIFPARRIPKRIRHEGVWYERDIAAEHRGVRHTPGNWPMTTTGALDGVPPHQVKELNEYLTSKGVQPCALPDGRMCYSDNTHRNAVLKARGFIDRDACFRQHAGENT